MIHLAAELEVANVAIVLEAMPYRLEPYLQYWSLRDDPVLRRQTERALHETGVSVSLADGFVVSAGGDMSERATDFSIVADLGAPYVNTVTFDRDLGRSMEQFGVVADEARAVGMRTVMEFSPTMTVVDLASAVKVVEALDRPDFSLLVDSMHLFRSGGTLDEVRSLDPALIGYVQLADCPAEPAIPEYKEEACFERRVPGEGDLPLAELMALVPGDVVIGLEVPLRSMWSVGLSAQDRVGRCVQATCRLLEGRNPAASTRS